MPRKALMLGSVVAASIVAGASGIAYAVRSSRDGTQTGPLPACDPASVMLDAYTPWPAVPQPFELDARVERPCHLEADIGVTVTDVPRPGAPTQPFSAPRSVHIASDVRGTTTLGWLTVTNWCSPALPMIEFRLGDVSARFPDESQRAQFLARSCPDITEAASGAVFTWVPWDPSAVPSPAEAGTTPQTASEQWATVRLTAASDGELTVALPSGVPLVLQLSAMAVFDCRIDCFRDVKSGLQPLDGSDTLCLFALTGPPLRPMKLWVDRPVCAPGPGP